MTNPFDAAEITPLFGMDWVLSLLRACREINKDKPEHQKWIDEACRVLEAAGKIDEDDYFWAGRGSVSGNTIDLLAIILATLAEPDGGKK